MQFLLLAALLSLAACNPVLNWREARAEPTTLSVLLPCKPDRAARTLPLAGRDTMVNVMGCEAGGATFAVAFATLDPAQRPDEVLVRWRAATLDNMQGRPSVEKPLALPGALLLDAAARVSATGRRADGSSVHSEAAYFARGREVFQVVIYADAVPLEASETFFESLKFQ